ncbi:MAG TPA: DUF2934 domain-containing protein [Verrucomicrobiae bacterium]|jgi:hypothetical protein|nr:DUF2934 domain-containing protein [Verrucomicrobiae bacterium]
MNTETQRKTTTKTRIPKETAAPAAQAVIAQPATTTTTTAKAQTPAAPLAPTRDAIAKRAYELYLARGKADGQQLEDWIQAERELLAVSHRYN